MVGNAVETTEPSSALSRAETASPANMSQTSQLSLEVAAFCSCPGGKLIKVADQGTLPQGMFHLHRAVAGAT